MIIFLLKLQIYLPTDLGSPFVRRKKSMGGRSQRENFVWRGVGRELERLRY